MPAVSDFVRHAETFENDAFDEIAAVSVPASAATEMERALYVNAYFCALQNYKVKGDFKGFMAGCSYLFPARTYFRDSYFTVLAMYNGQTAKIREEILTLCRGVSDDGTCPSAVKSDFTPWWGNHMDSPSLFCMMVYDYVNNTQDLSLLDEEVDGVSVLTKVRTVLDRLSEKADDTGLLVKSGKYNRLDWADEVNRYGYVAYDEILYARALYCVGKLTGLKKDPASTRYEESFRTVTAAINEVLWDETLGYYVNFKNEDYTEKNLSVDTVLAAVFGIADGARAKRLLANCEKLLESRSHAEIEDFGVMCVYPPYERINAACNKSACPMNYHNGAEWPYWSAMYAYARKLHGLEHSYALTRWFEYNTMRGNYTPIEYDSPYCEDGSLLQAWSSAAAFVYFDEQGMFFKNKI